MVRDGREPRRGAWLAALALASAGLVACRSGGRDAAPSPSVTTSTPSPSTSSPAPVRPTVIGVIGDWGIEGGPVRDVVRLMGGFNGGRPLDAVTTTGDNAYHGGRPKEAAFAAAVIKPLLRPGVPLYASLGNHDVHTEGGRHVIRALGVPGRWYTAIAGPVELVVLDSNRPNDKAQLEFLRTVLAAPRPVAFRVVVFHHPPTSCSLHGADKAVGTAWVPQFAGRVDLVLAGHNHTYERFMAGTLPYVTTGGGGARLYPSIPGLCKGPAKAVFVRTVHHAVRLTATFERLTLEAIGLDGKTFDRWETAAP